MKATWRGGFAAAAVAALLAGVLVGVQLSQPVRGNDEPKGLPNGPRYTVVETRAVGLMVTDNRTNTLYFYSPDAGAGDGADLKLRGTIDLNGVGKDTLPLQAVKK